MERTTPDARVAWALAEVHAHLAEADVPALAARLNLSPSRFGCLFAIHVGVAPSRYLRRLRLRRARLLIERTFLPLEEVMVLVGYHDPHRFARDFRRFHGLPPDVLRSADAATPLKAAGNGHNGRSSPRDPTALGA